MPQTAAGATKGERTRRRIVSLAAPLFNTRGFAGTSLSDIIATTGLEKGGIYRHFESKDELAIAAFDHAWELLRARYAAVLQPPAGAYERLIGFVETARLSVRDPVVQGGCPILNTATEADDTHPALRARAAGALHAWQGELAAIAAEALAAGDLHDVAPETVATVLIAAIEGAIMTTALLRDVSQMDRVAAHLTSWLTSLRRPPARRRR